MYITKLITIVILVGIIKTCPADVICGEAMSTWIKLGNIHMRCISDDNPPAADTSNLVELNRNFHTACLEYDKRIFESSSASSIAYYLTNCRVKSYGCGAKHYIADNTCITCPTGSLSFIPISNPTSIDDLVSNYSHKETSCQYCQENYYWDQTKCVACPDAGMRDNAEYQPSISKCYKTLDTGTTYHDDTGEYKLDAGASTVQCFYDN